MNKIAFVLDGKEYKLYFGMVAIEIWQKKAYEEAVKRTDSNTTAFTIKAFAYVIYAGLCNQAEIDDKTWPDFEEAYELCDAILSEGTELQTKIWDTFSNSRAGKPILDKLNADAKKSKKKLNQISTALGNSPTES